MSAILMAVGVFATPFVAAYAVCAINNWLDRR